MIEVMIKHFLLEVHILEEMILRKTGLSEKDYIYILTGITFIQYGDTIFPKHKVCTNENKTNKLHLFFAHNTTILR